MGTTREGEAEQEIKLCVQAAEVAHGLVRKAGRRGGGRYRTIGTIAADPVLVVMLRTMGVDAAGRRYAQRVLKVRL